ncbi:hypothetical protein KAR48_05380 [bacterium]|nr:hypothetical protein [bacterium]
MAEEQKALTLWSGQHQEGIVIEGVEIPAPKTDGSGHMWIEIRDRKELSLKANVTLTKLDKVPAELEKYSGDKNYLMFVATVGLVNTEIIRGDLFDFLNKNGGGPQLYKNVQVMNAMGVAFGYYNYCLASIMGTETGFEAASYSQNTPVFLPLKLEKFGDLYTLLNTFPK